MSTPFVSAVIVAWNSGEGLALCLESLRESARLARVPLQVVIVDNASSDGAVDGIGLDEGDVVVRNPVNAGYGVAAAQGIARAGAPWVLLLNPDVVVLPEFLGALAAAASKAPPTVATLVPELRFASRPDIVNCRGLTVDEIGVPAEVDVGRRSETGAAPSLPILGGSSGCCLLRTAAVYELGGPEPAFFAYLEDVDLALRLSRAGYDSLFVPEAIALHEGSASTGATSPLKVFLVARNRRVLFRLHGPTSPSARALRAIVDLAHAAYSSLATPLAPWAGRFNALSMHRYVAFLRASRRRHDRSLRAPTLSPRAPLATTLRRKRAILEAVEQQSP